MHYLDDWRFFLLTHILIVYEDDKTILLSTTAFILQSIGCWIDIFLVIYEKYKYLWIQSVRQSIRTLSFKIIFEFSCKFYMSFKLVKECSVLKMKYSFTKSHGKLLLLWSGWKTRFPYNLPRYIASIIMKLIFITQVN